MRRIRLPDAEGDDRGTTAGAGEPLRLAVLGDSSAAGVGAATHEEALAGQVAVCLADLLARPVSWRVAGQNGATVAMVRRGLVDRLTDPHTRWRPDLVLVSAGVNDVIRLRSTRAFRRDVADLVAAIRHRVGRRVPVLLAGLPPVQRFRALPAPLRVALAVHARRFDRELRRLAKAGPDLHHLPVAQLPVPAGSFFASDRLHPSPAGYRTWGRALATQIAAVVAGHPATGW